MSTKAPSKRSQLKDTSEPASTVLPPASKPVPEERSIPASLFTRYPFNRAPKADAVMEMCESIKDVGQLQPITCRSIGRISEDQPEQFEIIFGETRWLGCQKIHPDFPVRAYVLDVDDKETARIHAVENFQRRDLDEIEEAESIKNMRDNGWTMEEIMVSLGREKTHIYRRLTILKLSDEAKAAIRDRNLSVNTAEMIAGLPEDQREAALKAVTEPKYSDKALPERDAIALLKRDFVEPLKKAKEWEEQREALEKEYPGAKWLPYEEARNFRGDNYVHVEFATRVPDDGYLTDEASDRIKEPEVELPKWGELAKKHGIGGVIACESRYSDTPTLYIYVAPVIAAERAADPQSFFADPDAKSDDDDDSEEDNEEQRKAKAEKDRALGVAVEGERLKLIEHFLSGGATSKASLKRLVEMLLIEYGDGCSFDDWEKVFPGHAEDADYEARETHFREAIAKYLKPKGVEPLEALGRVLIALQLAGAGGRPECYGLGLGDLVFQTGVVKRANYPALNERFPMEDEAAPAADGESEPEGGSSAE